MTGSLVYTMVRITVHRYIYKNRSNYVLITSKNMMDVLLEQFTVC